jgi:hypothetical protein
LLRKSVRDVTYLRFLAARLQQHASILHHRRCGWLKMPMTPAAGWWHGTTPGLAKRNRGLPFEYEVIILRAAADDHRLTHQHRAEWPSWR